MPPEGHLRGAGTLTSCDAAAGLTASLGSAFSDQNDPNQTANGPTQGTPPADSLLQRSLEMAAFTASLASLGFEQRQAAIERRKAALTVAREERRQAAFERQKAATDIAAGWRGHVARRSADCEQQASAAIARGWRRKQAQADAAATLAMLSAARRRTRAATALVSHWRGHAARLWSGPVAGPKGHATGAPPLDQLADERARLEFAIRRSPYINI